MDHCNVIDTVCELHLKMKSLHYFTVLHLKTIFTFIVLNKNVIFFQVTLYFFLILCFHHANLNIKITETQNCTGLDTHPHNPQFECVIYSTDKVMQPGYSFEKKQTKQVLYPKCIERWGPTLRLYFPLKVRTARE